MKVTQVAVRPTEASLNAGRPSLTPELLAASGARYSRNNEGLEAILAKIDPDNLDKSVDSIFRMIDYGHQSIADMAPTAMFMDGVSMWLAYYIWTLVPTAGGQESSTRYIKISAEALTPPEKLGIPEDRAQQWYELMERSYEAYGESLRIWKEIAAADPSVARIPRELLQDESSKAQKAAARMKRNYAFDRSRCYLPTAALTNVMLIMSARAWTALCRTLLSHPLPEARALGEAIRTELELAAPRMMKHATVGKSFVEGSAATFRSLSERAGRSFPEHLKPEAASFECPPTPFLEVMPPHGIVEEDLAADLAHHDNRYSWIGDNLKRTTVRFGWDAVALGEIRDLNRHRTGTKYCPLIPQGFYASLDQIPEQMLEEYRSRLGALAEVGREASTTAYELLREGDPSYVYWTLLGTQFPFEHTTTADKFIYEAELRTGTGAHYRYARHLHDTLMLWYERFPKTKALILEGSAEPE